MIIGLNGYKRSGKDTAAAYLEAAYGFKRLRFAGLLYESAAAVFGLPASTLEDYKDDPRASIEIWLPQGGDQQVFVSLTIREYLQRYGTEAHRDVFGQQFWVDQLLHAGGLKDTELYAISDARFSNELVAIRALGGINVRIERDVADGDAHASETPPSPELVDVTIDNTRDLDWLYDQLDALCIGRWIQPLDVLTGSQE